MLDVAETSYRPAQDALSEPDIERTRQPKWDANSQRFVDGALS